MSWRISVWGFREIAWGFTKIAENGCDLNICFKWRNVDAGSHDYRIIIKMLPALKLMPKHP